MAAIIYTYAVPCVALAGLLESLVGSRDALSASKEELDFLSNLLQSKELHALFRVYNTIVDRVRDDRRCSPVLSSSMQTTLDVMEVLLPRIALSDASRQLFQLLQNPHVQVTLPFPLDRRNVVQRLLLTVSCVQGLLCAHDAVAQKDYLPRLPDIPQEMDEDEETIKIVQLVKSTEPLVLCDAYDVVTAWPKHDNVSLEAAAVQTIVVY